MVEIGRALARARRGDVSPRVAREPVTLHGRWLLLARLAFAAFAALALWLILTTQLRAVRDVGGLWLAAVGDPADARAARAEGGPRLAGYLALGALGLLGKVAYYGAALLLVRRSREAIALIVALFLVASAAAAFPPDLFAQLATEPVRATVHLAVTLAFALTFVWLFYLFPNGRFTPRWTLVPAAVWALNLAYTFFVARALASAGAWQDALVFSALFISAVVAQVQRYRRVSGPVERQQTKWFLGGLGVSLVTFLGGNVFLAANGALTADATGVRVAVAWTIFEVANGLAGLCVPVGLAVAVLRYRLFAIDVLLNRALVYGGLTACIVGLYVLIVGYLGALFRLNDAGGNLAISLVATGMVAVLFQPLRERLQRVANRLLYGQRDEPYAVLSRLGRQLEGTLAPDAILPAIVGTVASALKLPYAAIALQGEGGATVAAEYGAAPPGPPVAVPLVYQGERMGELRLAPRPGERALAPADQRLLEDLARQAGVAAHAVRLTADLRRSRERLVSIREEERRRLRRDLHDGLGPMLGSLTLKLDVADDLVERDPAGAHALLRDLKAQAQGAIADIRRLVYDLRPPALDDLGLVGALRAEAAQHERGALLVAVEAPVELPPLPAAVEVAAYRIAQEALTNVARHAGARSCTIRLAVDNDALVLEVIDDGRGLRADRGRGVGLASMRERAEELGGTCVVEARPGGGTGVRAALPFTGSAAPTRPSADADPVAAPPVAASAAG